MTPLRTVREGKGLDWGKSIWSGRGVVVMQIPFIDRYLETTEYFGEWREKSEALWWSLVALLWFVLSDCEEVRVAVSLSFWCLWTERASCGMLNVPDGFEFLRGSGQGFSVMWTCEKTGLDEKSTNEVKMLQLLLAQGCTIFRDSSPENTNYFIGYSHLCHSKPETCMGFLEHKKI